MSSFALNFFSLSTSPFLESLRESQEARVRSKESRPSCAAPLKIRWTSGSSRLALSVRS